MKIGAAYIRVSTEDQTELSPDSQLSLVREYAKKNDIIIPDEFIFSDEGISGRKTQKRDGFNRMIGLAKTEPKPFEIILLWKYSRFARNREDSIVYKSMLRKQLGIEVVSVSENIGDDKISIITESIIEAMDEYYSINLSEEVKRGMIEKVKRGGAVSIPSLGYKMHNKQYEIDNNTAPLVQSIFKDYLSNMGLREIAKKLNNEGHRTVRGNNFTNRSIEYILRNPVYIGKIRWNPTGRTYYDFDNPNIMTIDGTHQPIISIDTWNRTQEKLDNQKKLYHKHAWVNPPSPFLWQGLIKCSNCGATMTRATKEGMQCHNYARGSCGISHYISMVKLKEIVFLSLRQSLSSGNFILDVRSKTANQPYELSNLISKEYIKLERVKLAYENGIDTIEEYKASKTKIMQAIKHLEAKNKSKPFDYDAEKKNFQSDCLKSLDELEGDKLTDTEKNHLMRTFIDKIVFDRSNCSVSIYLYK